MKINKLVLLSLFLLVGVPVPVKAVNFRAGIGGMVGAAALGGTAGALVGLLCWSSDYQRWKFDRKSHENKAEPKWYNYIAVGGSLGLVGGLGGNYMLFPERAKSRASDYDDFFKKEQEECKREERKNEEEYLQARERLKREQERKRKEEEERNQKWWEKMRSWDSKKEEEDRQKREQERKREEEKQEKWKQNWKQWHEEWEDYLRNNRSSNKHGGNQGSNSDSSDRGTKSLGLSSPVAKVLNVQPNANAYEVLGLQKGVDKTVASRSLKKLAAKYHPDKHPDNRELYNEAMTAINQAYQVLFPIKCDQDREWRK